MIKIEIFDDVTFFKQKILLCAYESLLISNPTALFYYSIKFLMLLKEVLENIKIYWINAYEDGILVGSLPCILKETSKGNILNSLPFYGSHGGPIVKEGHKNQIHIKNCLIEGFQKLACDLLTISSTLIENPFDQINLSEIKIDYTDQDYRIGQFTKFPPRGGDTSESLLKLFHYKTRNAIRKGLKSGFEIIQRDEVESLRSLYVIHEQNMLDIGGKSKPWQFFKKIPEIFEYEEDYKIYFAVKDGVIVAGLLLFYFNKTVEYFTPVVMQEFRSFQPLSVLIFQAMIDAVEKNYSWWNWGGTWPTQESVYRFKSRWGALDKIYHYYTKIEKIPQDLGDKEKILEVFPYFYVRPF